MAAGKSFTCSHCGAPLEYTGEGTTVTCPYCSTPIIVPEELRPKQQVVQQVVQRVVVQSPRVTTSPIPGLIVVLVGMALVVFGIYRSGSMPGLMQLATGSTPRPTTAFPTIAVPTFEPRVADGMATLYALAGTPLPGSTPKPGIAQLALKFGSEGTGAGHFTDARSIAVDAAGTIYVGEYSSGRIQVFDPTGKYLRQWSIGDNSPLLQDMAMDRQGTLYAIVKGTIQRFDSKSGQALGPLPYSRNGFFHSVALRPTGGVVAPMFAGQDDLVLFDSAGKTQVWQKFVSTQSEKPIIDVKVAVDGMGNVFALGDLSDSVVFRFNASGKFITRVGSVGDGPGQIRAANNITVDSHSRIYVSDIWGVEVYAADGQFIGRIPSGVAFGLAVDDQDNLYIAGRNQVLKYTLTTK